MRKKRTSGFTLLELIIVVIVIGILASIALPRYIRIAEKGRAAEAKALLGALRASQMRYASQYSAYTANKSLLDINFQPDKYFSYVVYNATNVSDPAAVLATATRTSTDTPTGMVGYTVNITMEGNITGDTTAVNFL